MFCSEPRGRFISFWIRLPFHFRLRTLFLLVLLCQCGFGWPHFWRQVQFQRMKAYAGRDLRHLSEDEQARFAAIVKTVLGHDTERAYWQQLLKQPRFVRQTDHEDGSPLTIFCQSTSFMSIPGQDTAHLTVFGRFGQMLSDQTFFHRGSEPNYRSTVGPR